MPWLVLLMVAAGGVLYGSKVLATQFRPPVFRVGDAVKVPAKYTGNAFNGTVVGVTHGPTNIYAIGPLGSTSGLQATANGVNESELAFA